MARHAVNKSTGARSRALLRAGLTVTAAGAALGVGGAGAAAAAEPGPAAPQAGHASPLDAVTGTPAQALATALGHSAKGGFTPVRDLQLDPLANTSVDPLSNTLGTQVADFKPVSTAFATGPLASGASLGELPVVGGLLPR
ncbi:hypothetical protein AB0N81_35780 [Streptomyces sp. NPDC093510]|uniref:hypothetical protein n=1 Tax=Streptomyces sp. NPDC093510 TaxID=3155199 RepID=UPI00341B9216